jgi:hypothetical protein
MRAYTGVRKCPFHNLALATNRRQEIRRLVTSTSRDGVLIGTCLRVIHLQQIRFNRRGSLVVIHARDSILISFDALILSNVTVKIGSINCFVLLVRTDPASYPR